MVLWWAIGLSWWCICSAPEVGVLHFPVESTTDYLKLRTGFTADINALTVCTWVKDTKSRSSYWFSYHVDGESNTILLGRGINGLRIAWITGSQIYIKHQHNEDWYLFCVTWEIAGSITMWVDGTLIGTDVTTGTDVVQAGGCLIIGQDQDTRCGGFERYQAFSGSLYDMTVWSRVLSEHEIRLMYFGLNKAEHEIVLSWSQILMTSEILGNVEILETQESLPVYPEPLLDFPYPPSTNNYILAPAPLFITSLTELTICSWLLDTRTVDKNKRRWWFSYSSGRDEIRVSKGGTTTSFAIKTEFHNLEMNSMTGSDWHHVCVSWRNDGYSTISLNGHIHEGSGDMEIGNTVPSGGVLILGQEQDSEGGNFAVHQAFVGRLYDTSMWDRALSVKEMGSVYWTSSTKVENGALVTWEDFLNSPVYGNVTLQHIVQWDRTAFWIIDLLRYAFTPELRCVKLWYFIFYKL